MKQDFPLFDSWIGRAFVLSILLLTSLVAGCHDPFDDTEINNRLDELESRIEKLEADYQTQMNALQVIASLQEAIAALQSSASANTEDIAALAKALGTAESEIEKALKDLQDGVTTIGETLSKLGLTISAYRYHDSTGRYEIVLSNGTVIELLAKDTAVDAVKVREDSDGKLYWSVNGEFLTDSDGNKIPVYVTPEVRINTSTKEVEVSVNGGTSWHSTGMFMEDEVPALFSSVTSDEYNVYFTLADGTTLTVALLSDMPEVSVSVTELVVMPGETGYVTILMRNVEKYIIVKPAGWRAAVSENLLGVTAPLEGVGVERGSIQIFAVSSDGKSTVCEFRVRLGEQDGPVEHVFTASFGPGSKTVFDEVSMSPMWLGDSEGNEYIMVMEPDNVSKYVARGITEPVEKATFERIEGSALSGKAAYAVYPAGPWTCSETGVSVIYPGLQTAYANAYDPSAHIGIAYNADVTVDRHFSFVNACAFLKFSIKEDSEPVRSVKVTALGGEALSGAMTITYDDTDLTVVGSTVNVNSSVELAGKDNAVLEPGKSYYIVAAPAVLSSGIAVRLNNDEANAFELEGKLALECGGIHDIGEFSAFVPVEPPVNPDPDPEPDPDPVPAWPLEYTQWTWYDSGCKYTRLLDWSVTEKGIMHIAGYYNEMAAAAEEEVLDPEYVGKYISMERITEYDVEVLDETSGIITWASHESHEVYGDYTTYFRIEYSNLTSTTLDVFSPSTFYDENGDFLPVFDENGIPMVDSDGWPVIWNGLGLCIRDGTSLLPINITLSEKKLDVVIKKASQL